MSTDNIQSIIKEHYSNSNSKLNQELNTVTVTVNEVINNLSDLIPKDDYMPFYISQFHKLGYKRYMGLANKARAGRDPMRLFFWMLKNNEIVQ